MKPAIAITMGDVCGIGPEIIARSLADPELYDLCRPVVVGDADALIRARDLVGAKFSVVRRSEGEPLAAEPSPAAVPCVDPGLKVGDLPYGHVDARAGHAAFEFVRLAVGMAQARRVAAIVTASLNKEALHKGGHLYAGHTEILADLTGSRDYAMMLATPKLKIVHLTTHVGLIDAIERITPERTYRVIRLAWEALTRAGLAAPRIAVCAINPHAGENGLFGRGEEREKLQPGIDRAVSEGIAASGPWPADTIFFRAMRGEFDMVVACYHDQGHIPAKLLSIEDGVNVTLGLGGGIIRTSVDHGTAFDIAGKTLARHQSLIAAVHMATQLMPKDGRD